VDSRQPNNLDWQKFLPAVVRTVRELHTGIQFMRSIEVVRMRAEDLFPFDVGRVAILMIEESTLAGFDKKLVRRIAVR
jgi:hypothetical protein